MPKVKCHAGIISTATGYDIYTLRVVNYKSYHSTRFRRFYGVTADTMRRFYRLSGSMMIYSTTKEVSIRTMMNLFREDNR